ncbi:MAG: PD-(D/E)XK nuclease family transposase, partial [Cellulosilyticum sp.]|nr:PD-(D/E)XK nuclease family transposase [Cellulosilyticum sp.]
ELHFIEFKKMKNVKRVEEVKNKLEAWLYFINQPDSELVQVLEKVDVERKEAKAELIRLSGDRKERERYEKRRESRLNEISALSYAEEKGVKRRNIEIAKNLLDVLDDETISLKTGLSIEQVKEIRKEQN